MTDITLRIEIDHPDHDEARAYANRLVSYAEGMIAGREYFNITVRLDDPVEEAATIRQWWSDWGTR